MRTGRMKSRFGWTLVELLVVMAVLGLLVGMLLPALQTARKAAQRAQCTSNLHQMGVALQAHHSALGYFPIGGVEWRPFRSTKGERQLAWSAFLLPYLDQQPLYDQLNLRTPFDSPDNRTAAAVVLAVYLCPSTYRASPLVSGRGACDYGGMYGERILSPNNPPKGVMLYDQKVSTDMIPDGTSNTLQVGEDSGFADGQWINGRNLFDQAFGINQAPAYENDIRSNHQGGANTLFCDGSVHFLAETLDLPILAALCTRAGNEPGGGF